MTTSVLNQSIELEILKTTGFNPWRGTPFQDIQKIAGPDKTGGWGERLLFMLAEDAGFEVIWLEDKNTNLKDGIYDMLFEGKRVEVKTSFRGTTKRSWQHENILINPNNYDYLCMIDVDHDAIFFSILSYEEIHKDVTSQWNEVHEKYCGKVQPFNLTPTFRGSTRDKFKINTSYDSFDYGRATGVTYKWDNLAINPFNDEESEMADRLTC